MYITSNNLVTNILSPTQALYPPQMAVTTTVNGRYNDTHFVTISPPHFTQHPLQIWEVNMLDPVYNTKKTTTTQLQFFSEMNAYLSTISDT